MTYFNSKIAEFLDHQSLASQARAIELKKDFAAGAANYRARNLTAQENLLVKFLEDNAMTDFKASVTGYRRSQNATHPTYSVPFPNLDAYIYGFNTGAPPPNDYAPGLYAFVTFQGRYQSPDGGQSGFTYCSGDMATTTVRTSDIFTSVSADTPSVVNSARLVFDWEKIQGIWYIKTFSLTPNEVGLLSFTNPYGTN